MASHLTYEYHGDEIRAMFGDKVIACGTEFAKVACSAEEYFNSLKKKKNPENDRESARKTATHILTPNGAKGEILNRVSSVWGNKITVRFENGQIRYFDTMAGADDKLSYIKEAAADAPTSMVEVYQRVLDQDYEHGIKGLTSRLEELDKIIREASTSIRVASDQDMGKLHKIVLAAEAETMEVKDALAHLQDSDTEAYMPPSFAAVEQADLGRSKGDTWLDVVAQKMIADSEAEDYDKLLDEGPTELVSSLGDAAVHDASIVREAAINHIHSRTAGFKGEKIDAYREAFVAKAEQARRTELSYRTQTQKEATQKETSLTENISDEALFL